MWSLAREGFGGQGSRALSYCKCGFGDKTYTPAQLFYGVMSGFFDFDLSIIDNAGCGLGYGYGYGTKFGWGEAIDYIVKFKGG